MSDANWTAPELRLYVNQYSATIENDTVGIIAESFFPETESDYYEEHRRALKLMAAAPELYKALELMVKRADEGGYMDGTPMKTARVALAKARGEE